MKKLFAISALTACLSLPALPTYAASCADLWYDRNLIFAENGYCFSTRLARRTFRNFDCWTTNPRLSRSERRRIAAIKREERRRGCKVN